jgi:hypothetical protein
MSEPCSVLAVSLGQVGNIQRLQVEGSVGFGLADGEDSTALGASAELAAVLVAVQLLGKALEMFRCEIALVGAGARAERRVARIAKAAAAV